MRPTHVLVGRKSPGTAVTAHRDLGGAAVVGAQVLPGLAAIPASLSRQLLQPSMNAAEPAFERFAYTEE